MRCFLCEVASPYQKGSIENRNGVIRTVYARDCDILKISQKQIDREISAINARPMRYLNYRSPEQLFHQLLTPAC